MGHEHIELSAYLDGELSAAERRRVETRLASEPEYAAELARLERIKTMLSCCIEQPASRMNIVAHIRNEEHSVRNRRWLLRVAAGFLLVAVAALAATFANQFTGIERAAGPGQPDSPMMPAIGPSNLDSDSPSSGLLASADTGDGQPETPESGAEAILPLELLGTVTGAAPSAIIAATTGDGREVDTFVVGDSVLEGLTLVEVRAGSVALDANGELLVLEKLQAPHADPLDKLVGIWDCYEVVEGSEPRIFGQIRTEKADGLLRVSMPDQEESAELRCNFSGPQIRFTAEPGSGIPQEMLGTPDNDFNALSAQVIIDENGEAPAGAGAVGAYLMTRVRPDDATSKTDVKTKIARCKAEVEWMQKALKRFANDNGGNYPQTLNELVPKYQDDLSSFADNDNRVVTYISGLSTKPPVLPARPTEPSIQPIASFPQRLMAHEARLRAAGFGALLSLKAVLRVQYQSPPIEVRAYARGGTRLHLLDDRTAYGSDSEGQLVLAELRAECQNVLKYLGLVIKMYMNEHEDYTPPGWLAAYPQYVDAWAMTRSPSEVFDADFYEYLLPATNIEGFLDESVTDTENPAARAKAMSEIPLVINRKNWPGPSGRNILFADGHVEYSRSWEEVLARIR